MLRCATIILEASHAVVVMDIGWTPMDILAMVSHTNLNNDKTCVSMAMQILMSVLKGLVGVNRHVETLTAH